MVTSPREWMLGARRASTPQTGVDRPEAKHLTWPIVNQPEAELKQIQPPSIERMLRELLGAPACGGITVACRHIEVDRAASQQSCRRFPRSATILVGAWATMAA